MPPSSRLVESGCVVFPATPIRFSTHFYGPFVPPVGFRYNRRLRTARLRRYIFQSPPRAVRVRQLAGCSGYVSPRGGTNSDDFSPYIKQDKKDITFSTTQDNFPTPHNRITIVLLPIFCAPKSEVNNTISIAPNYG
ncbi:AGAP001576-PA [Anopheles gambiae str. PEST]|uniref:AGAP001576-PA n=1 Tax=Anopheles gambiae TaxID=7165 RepID=Q8T5L1_ANOGA|nr:AGAP001576-PA [Anopheles gambiae str. PEST]CAD27477.1 hypothetical protein [Anopheles gambiae]